MNTFIYMLILVFGWLGLLEDLLLFAELAESGAVGAQASDPEGGRDVLEQRRRHYRIKCQSKLRRQKNVTTPTIYELCSEDDILFAKCAANYNDN